MVLAEVYLRQTCVCADRQTPDDAAMQRIRHREN